MAIVISLGGRFFVSLHKIGVMKKILFSIISFLLVSLATRADEPLFPYPEAPADIELTQDRCAWVAERFWDRCDLKQAMSARSKLNQAFNDFISIVALADAESAHRSVNKLIDKARKNPDQLLALCEMAEGYMYSDTASIVCDELYFHFADAVANNKKIKSADKARYVSQARILGGCQVGMTAPDIPLTLPDGKVRNLSDIKGKYIILFFNDPDCVDCMMARVRLSADYNINQFIKKGQLEVVSIYPGESDDDNWTSSLSLMPDNWVVGSSAEADMVYDMRHPPVIYYLNRDHMILSKSMTTDQLISAFREINTRSN